MNSFLSEEKILRVPHPRARRITNVNPEMEPEFIDLERIHRGDSIANFKSPRLPRRAFRDRGLTLTHESSPSSAAHSKHHVRSLRKGFASGRPRSSITHDRSCSRCCPSIGSGDNIEVIPNAPLKRGSAVSTAGSPPSNQGHGQHALRPRLSSSLRIGWGRFGLGEIPGRARAVAVRTWTRIEPEPVRAARDFVDLCLREIEPHPRNTFATGILFAEAIKHAVVQRSHHGHLRRAKRNPRCCLGDLLRHLRKVSTGEHTSNKSLNEFWSVDRGREAHQ